MIAPLNAKLLMLNKEDLVHLHVHSEYSNIRLLDSINKIANMIKHVSSLGQTALALTDHESLSGHVKFIKAVKELKKKNKIPQDFKPILGNEIYLVDEEEMRGKIEKGESVRFYHFLLLAKDAKGHEQLRKLSSRAWERMFNFKGMDRVPTFYTDIEEIVGGDPGHIIASTACLGSYFASNVLRLISEDCEDEMYYKQKIHNFVTWCIEIFGEDDFYIEIQPSKESIEQIEYNKMAITIAKAYGLKHVITTDAHYTKREDRNIHKAYLTSDENDGGDREVDAFYSSTHFFTNEMLLDYLDYLDEEDIISAIKNTKEIADKVEEYDLAHKQIIPKVKLSKETEWFYNEELYNKGREYTYIKQMIESDEIYDRYLISLTLNGVKEKIPKKDFNETFERIDIECKEILEISEAKQEPVSSYFVTMEKNIDIIWEEAQSVVGTSRGSAAGFIINYLIGITQINPLKQDGIEMPHWRFISGSRPDLPDVDIDISSHKRDIAFKCLSNYYESIGGRIVRVCTFGTETSKSTILTACRGLKINNDIGLYLSSLIPVERGFVWSIEDCYYGNEELGRDPVPDFKNTVDKYEGLLEVALGIQGLVNKRSSHACFDEETLVTTSEGLKRIVDVKIGDMVLTHNRRFKPVVDLIQTRTDETYELKTKSSFSVEVTGNHPFYVREMTTKGRTKIFSVPKWKNASELVVGHDHIGIPINNESIIPNSKEFDLPFDNKDFWWIIGRYLGDGWTECHSRQRKTCAWEEKRVIICCSKVDETEKDLIVKYLNKVNFEYRTEEVNTTYKIHIKNNDLYNYLQSFGRYAHGKYINQDVFNLPKDLVMAFLDGYISADGHYYEDRQKYSMKTVSKKLAIGLMQLINKAYQRHASLVVLPPKTEYIDGRKIRSREKYEICFAKNMRTREKSFYEDGYIWTRVSKLTKKDVKYKTMYNLTVLDDSSYIVHGLCAHNCGVLIVNEDFTKHNAIMRTPSKEIVSQFNLEDSEYVGNIKYDLLNTKTCGMIQTTLEMLIKHGKIDWQGTLRKTYDKYLHPDIIDRTSPEMWELLHRGELISAFQFDSPVGEQALKSIKPMSLLEATNSNNLMRLMSEGIGKEQPLEMYVRYKNNIDEWYRDMKDFGLNDKEIETMKKHLLQDYGVCSSQERMMLLSMDENIANFDVVESNTLRKSVAKKKKELLEQSEQRLHEKGIESGASKTLLQYVWDIQIAMQRGYGFSVLHGVGYTYILIQQLNLVYYFPSIFWNTAVLLVESGALEQDTLDDEDDEEETRERKEKTTNYGTVAKAIGNMQKQGVKIALPDINVADLGFKPDEDNDQIVFGLKGIMKISNDTSRLIMEHRPFSSLEDFYKRMVLTKREVTLKTGKKQNKSLVSDGQTIMLIKAGAFDKLENKPREEILLSYLKMTNPDKKSLTTKGIDQVINMGIVSPEYKDYTRFHNFKNYINNNVKKQDEETKTVKWHSLSNGDQDVTDYAVNFFNEHYAEQLNEGRDYYFDEDGIIWVAMGTSRKGSFSDVHKQKMEPFMKWIESKDCVDAYNEHVFNEIKRDYMSGTISSWEMQSLNYYNSLHELAYVDKEKYQIVDFFELPEEPEVVGFTRHRGIEYPKFQLQRILGTVLDKDKNKHMISLLTPTGVVQIKFYGGQFAFYDKTISSIGDDGKKTVMEESWFKRGNLLMVTGFRRGDQFRPKRYTGSIFPHTLQKIIELQEDGTLILQSDRHREDE